MTGGERSWVGSFPPALFLFYLDLMLAGYSLSIDDDNKRITKKNERIMAKICQV